MPTNLRIVRDHPVNVLNRYAADAYSEGRHSYGDHYSTAATRLFGYEVENGVTFAALDNDALAAVREAYEGYVWNRDHQRQPNGIDLARAISDLLGLED